MPNWANNTLIVQGNDRDIAVFREQVRRSSGDFDLSLLRPMPVELVGTISPAPSDKNLFDLVDMYDRGVISYERMVELRERTFMDLDRAKAAIERTGYASWYDWCIDHWGTKWPPSDVELTYDEDQHLEFVFNTAWSPPGNLVQFASSMFPLLTFTLRFGEESRAFAGCSIYVNGRCAAEEVYSFSSRGLPEQFADRYAALMVESDDWESNVELLNDLESEVLDYAVEMATSQHQTNIAKGLDDVSV